MIQRHLILATLVCTLFSVTLSAQAQEKIQQETSFVASVHPAQNPVSSTNTAANAQSQPARTRGSYFFASAKRHPLTPRDVSMREAVESLGIDKHRFVRCELKDGTHVICGISSLKCAEFAITQGIMNGRHLQYSELKQPPEPIPAVGEHFLNGLKWTGVVVVCVAVLPFLYPLGIMTD
jgi:hypothetical protein